MTTNARRLQPFPAGAPVQHQGSLTADQMAWVNAWLRARHRDTALLMVSSLVALSRISQRRESSPPAGNLVPTREILTHQVVPDWRRRVWLKGPTIGE
jgi:hypothetical protein